MIPIGALVSLVGLAGLLGWYAIAFRGTFKLSSVGADLPRFDPLRAALSGGILLIAGVMLGAIALTSPASKAVTYVLAAGCVVGGSLLIALAVRASAVCSPRALGGGKDGRYG